MNHETTHADHAPADIGAQRVARVYAEALLNAAARSGQAEDVLGELDSLLDDVFTQAPDLEVLLTSGAVGRTLRSEAIEKGFAGRASELFAQFLRVLNDHERLDLLRAIRAAGHELYNERHRRLRVHVTAAVPLTDEQMSRLADRVRQKFGLEPVLVTTVDSSLLGGLRIQIGDRLIDASVRTRLNKIRNQLLARSSHGSQV